MAGTVLVGFDVAAGQKVLDALSGDGIDISVALWARVSDYDIERLFIASPDFEHVSKLEAHARIEPIVQPQFSWSAPNVVILKMKDPFVVALRDLFAEAASVTGMRIGSQTIGNRYVEDAYVYLIR